MFLLLQAFAVVGIREQLAGARGYAWAAGLLLGFNLFALLAGWLLTQVLFNLQFMQNKEGGREKNRIYGVDTAVLLAFACNLGIWVLVPWGVVLATQPALVVQTGGVDIMRYIVAFAALNLPEPTSFWFLNLVTYFILFAIFAKNYIVVDNAW